MATHLLTEHQRLLLLEEEYQRRGYETYLYPASDQLPPSLQDVAIGVGLLLPASNKPFAKNATATFFNSGAAVTVPKTPNSKPVTRPRFMPRKNESLN